MNSLLRKQATLQNTSLMEFILQKMNNSKNETGINKTIFAACPNSEAVIKASLRSAKRNNAPIKFAATLNQVDLDGGYTGLTQKQFVKLIRQEAERIHFIGPVIIAIDHGGPWLKDKHTREKWSYENTLNAVKKSFEAAILAGYDLIHVDPTIDITLPKGKSIDIEVVANRTVELIVHSEKYRNSIGFPQIAYEVGTEEVHGGLADMSVFHKFLFVLKEGLKKHGMEHVWPCFVVGKVGTDLHTTTFDSEVAKQLTNVVSAYGSYIKGHYSDSVSNPQDYPLSGMGAANVGPEFTESEYDALMELCELESNLFDTDKISKASSLKEVLWNAVINSGRWVKWAFDSESTSDFYANQYERQDWFIKTGCRYIWQNAEVIAARQQLYKNCSINNIDAEFIVLSRIEKAMDKYFYAFNLVDLNKYLKHEKTI